MSVKRLGSLYLRAADRANVHESEQAAKLADELAAKLPVVRYLIKSGVECRIVPERGGESKVQTLKSPLVLNEVDRVRSTAAISKGFLTFRTRLRGTKQYVITFFSIKNVEVF